MENPEQDMHSFNSSSEEPANDLGDTAPVPARPAFEEHSPDSTATQPVTLNSLPQEPFFDGEPAAETGDDPNLAETRAIPLGRQFSAEPEERDATMPVPVDQPIPPEPPAVVPAGAASFSVPPKKPAKPARKRTIWSYLPLIGLLALLLIAAASGYAGYQAGIAERTQAEASQRTLQLAEQFARAQQDMAEKNWDRARQRFEYIIRNDPTYPGVTDKLAQVQLALMTTATPTLAPTPTLTPTPDTRAIDARFSAAQQAFKNSKWDEAIEALLALRKEDPNFHIVEADDMLFLALRNRGVDKILKKGDLEGGIYDVTLSSRFGPLDAEAQSYVNWARLYITGASFWDIDWKQAVEYFSQVGPAMPGMRDGGNVTAKERYRLALIGYGDSIVNDDPCLAAQQYALALEMGPDARVEEVLAQLSKDCNVESTDATPDPNATPAPKVKHK